MPLKNLGHQKSIEKPLKALKNSAKGNEQEKLFSKIIHKKAPAVLVSSKLLRDYNCGQIDICTYQHSRLSLYEVKSSCLVLGLKQKERLLQSLSFLTSVFNAEGTVRLLNSSTDISNQP